MTFQEGGARRCLQCSQTSVSQSSQSSTKADQAPVACRHHLHGTEERLSTESEKENRQVKVTQALGHIENIAPIFFEK